MTSSTAIMFSDERKGVMQLLHQIVATVEQKAKKIPGGCPALSGNGGLFWGDISQTQGCDLCNFTHDQIPKTGLLLHEMGQCFIVQFDEVGLF